MKLAPTMRKDQTIVINISGRGDKDCAASHATAARIFMNKCEEWRAESGEVVILARSARLQ